MSRLAIIAIAVSMLFAAAYGLISYGRAIERAKNNASILQLQNALADLGLAMQREQDTLADATRQTIEAEQRRINAATIIDHQSTRIQQLERNLRAAAQQADQSRADKNSPADNLRVISIDVIDRVWNHARDNDQLPESGTSSVLQTRLPEITADGIATAIRYSIGQYNQCAIKYNQLWRNSDTIIEQKN